MDLNIIERNKKGQFIKGHPKMGDCGVPKGNIPWNKGKKTGLIPKSCFKKGSSGFTGKHTEKTKQKLRIKQLGVPAWNKGLKGFMSGSKNANWKGGITPKYIKIRQSTEMRLWRKAVFVRDNFTCQKYGIKGGKLIAHHINNFADFPELRFAIDNGITLSEEAHKEFHKIYGRKNNTKEQIKEFLKDCYEI